MQIKDNEFKCEMCGCTFAKGWSEQESNEELRRNFNEESKEDDAIVCDACYKAFLEKMFN